ncbi:MAG: amidohydrolase family protein [Streptosporangiales bacterium]|nr:amidohydrolase family protein [Streptosporangiales bacterium]
MIDVHQHLWPAEFIEALRRRAKPPRLDGWTLHLNGEPAQRIDPADHDPARRLAIETGTADTGTAETGPAGRGAGTAARGADVIVIGPSSPLGLEWLPPEEAEPLIDAWHAGALALGEPYRVWAATNVREPDPATVTAALDAGCAGLQLPADALAAPADLERLAPLLQACDAAGRPVMIHPGPARDAADRPGWWAAVVDYVAQLQAAWWSWHVAGRDVAPDLRVCFVAGAGLAPVHHERYAARGGGRLTVDPGVFADTSSYGRQGIDALTRVLGIDVIVNGTDRPYAEPAELCLGDAATHAIRRSNPRRLLEGGQP